jgi:hypothetical protein
MREILTRLLGADILLTVLVVSIGGLIGLLEAGQEPTYPTLVADLEPLRSAFNAQPENVRAILLASPT